MNRLLTAVSMALLASTVHAMSPEEATMIGNAAERGSQGAEVLMAVMYLNGDAGHARDDRLAAYWFEQAAMQGNAYAEQMLGDLYEQGRGLPKSLKLAADWREKAANRGNVQAQVRLGRMYLDGEGVAKDYAKAEHWLERAAADGNGEAQYLLGKMYHAGTGVQQNHALGDNLLARSAESGYEDAVKLITLIEDFGYQFEDALHQGAPSLLKLAQDGDAEAQYQLAVRYESGALGVERSPEKALYWFRRAADGGHVMAMKSLAHIYEKGLDGIAPDSRSARYWAEQAAASKPGHPVQR